MNSNMIHSNMMHSNMMNPHMMNSHMMSSNAMIDSIKSMAMTMAMVKTTTSSDPGFTSIINTVLLMIVVSFIDSIVIYIKSFVNYISSNIVNYLHKKTKEIPIISKTMSQPLIKSSITVKIESASKNPTSDAIIDLLTNLPETKYILLQNGIYSINYNEEIKITHKLFAKMLSSKSDNSETTPKMIEDISHELTVSNKQTELPLNIKQVDNQKNNSIDRVEPQNYGYVALYSKDLNMEELRNEVDTIVKNYLIKITNKLGNNIYYFTEIPSKIYTDVTGKIDYTKIPDTFHFSMKRFTTNRSFKNLFGRNIDIIRKRVDFFRNNKDWYDEKGVPYTLGIMVSGQPGSGKTSIIKCIANELKRHIINIHLSDTMTKNQLENLFYSEQINVLQNGKTETYTIPINKRVYVLEDVDCQCDIVLDRTSESTEQILIKKNEELKKQIQELTQIINNRNDRVKVLGGQNQNNQHPLAEESNQKITLSFLLNLFDGILETPGRITIMSTNFIEKLDKAFTRPGRIDVISKFGFSDYEQLVQIIEHRYDIKLDDEQKLLLQNLPNVITPAEVGRMLFENFYDLNGALDALANYAEDLQFKEMEKIKKIEETKEMEETKETKKTEKTEEMKKTEETEETEMEYKIRSLLNDRMVNNNFYSNASNDYLPFEVSKNFSNF